MKRGLPNPVEVSALKGTGIDKLLAQVSSLLLPGYKYQEITLPIDRPGLVNMLYEKGRVDSVEYLEDKIVIKGYFRENISEDVGLSMG